MSVFKREGSSFWWYAFTFKGQRYQRSSGVENKRDAEDIERAFRTNLAKGEVGLVEKSKVERKSVGQLLDGLKADYELRGKDGAKTASAFRVVKQAFGAKMADRLSAEDMTSYTVEMRKRKRADATIKNHLKLVEQAFRFAKLAPPNLPKFEIHNERSGFLNRKEFDRLMTHLPEDLRDFCLFAYITGWRFGAIRKLEWSDVRDGNIYLRKKHSKNRRPYFVPIPEMEELKHLVARREAARAVGTKDSGVVLCSYVFHRGGRPVGEFRKSWDSATVAAGLGKAVCKKCGSEGAGKICPKCRCRRKHVGAIFHDFRRTAARNLIRSGVSQNVAMRITGHETDSMFRRYNITSEDDLRDAMRKRSDYEKAQQGENRNVVSIAK